VSNFTSINTRVVFALLATGTLVVAAHIAAQPMSETDKLLLLDDALEYAAQETRNDATALAKLQDVLTRIDNLLPEIRLQVMQARARIYRDIALVDVNREAQRALTHQTLFQISQINVDDVAWKKAIDAYEETIAFARTSFPIAAAKSLAQIAELHTWKRNRQQRSHAFFRLRKILADAHPESSDDRESARRLMDFSFNNLVGLYAALSPTERNRLLAEFPSDLEIRAAWTLEEPQPIDEHIESDATVSTGADTLSTLMERRAPERIEAAQRVFVADDEGNLVDLIEHELANNSDVISALRKAYAPIAISIEHGVAGPEERIPFNILANMRLEDALKLLDERSEGHATWTLKNGRLIVQFQETREGISIPSVLSRPFPVRITADTVGDAMLEIEVAYNAVYHDIPMELDRKCLTFLHATPIPTDFLQDSPSINVRQAILKLLETIDKDGVMYYYASIMQFEPGQLFVQVMLSIPPPHCRDEFESGEEYEAFLAHLAERRARVNQYFDQHPDESEGEH